MSFETPQMDSAQRRRQQAEAKNELSVSHWQGELHSHTSTDISEPKIPEDIMEYREGSNCGKIPLELLTRYHAQEMKNSFMAITEHSRDASPEKAVSGITDWFYGMYLNNADWLRQRFGKTKEDLDSAELAQIKALAWENAKAVAHYGDERLENILAKIDDESGRLPMRIFKGVEANMLPDGSFDTDMVEQGRFDLVNCSIHPEVDPEGFAEIVKDPQKYQDLVLQGIANPKTNIMAHIGHDVDQEVVKQLDWDKIGQAAFENKVAIEINLRKLIKFIYRELMDYDKFPKSDTSWRDYFKEKLPELVPILSNPLIVYELKKYFEQGLSIAINTDEHENKFIDHATDKEGTQGEFKERDKRFWIAIKMLERYFNELFDQAGIKQKNIINTYTPEQLEKFLQKAG